jgi:hypothetical protein
MCENRHTRHATKTMKFNGASNRWLLEGAAEDFTQ